MEYTAILAMAAIDSLQPWNHCGQFGHTAMELLLAMAAMDSLQPFWPCGHGITFGHSGHGIATAYLAMEQFFINFVVVEVDK